MKGIKIAGALLGLAALAVLSGGSFGGATPEAVAATRVYPIVDLTTNYLLGGTSQGKWITTDIMSNTVGGGEIYRVYNLKGYLGKGAGTKAVTADIPCEETRLVDMKPTYKSSDAIGSGGSWAAMPRVPK